MTLGTPVDHVALQARLQPGRPAVAELASGRAWTYAAWDDAVARTAAVLHSAHGIGPGDRVATLARNCAELPLLHLACARLGAIYAPLNWRLATSELRGLLADAEPRVLFGDAERARHDFPGTTLADLAAATDAAPPLPPEPIDPDRSSLILFTSGTSGRPKGAMLSERNLEQTAINFGLLGRVTHASVFLADAPMFHVIGLVTNLRPVFMRGASVLISDGFEPARTLARLGDPALGVTHFFCVPQMAAMLRAVPGFDPAHLRGLAAIFTGGAPHPAAAIHAWLDDGVTIVDGYGMSEAGTVFGMPLDPALIRAKAGACGLPTPAVQARLIDQSGRDCPPGTPGELLLRGQNIFSGYWRRPEDTAAAFTPDGWFRTGDIAVRDADGFYRMVDRRKDMFISGGENVYPAEIEAALAGYPGLAETAVVGVPDARWGEVGHLVVVPLQGAAPPDPDALLAHLRARLAGFKLPRHISVLAALPRTGTGKVQKTILRARLLGDASQEPAT